MDQDTEKAREALGGVSLSSSEVVRPRIQQPEVKVPVTDSSQRQERHKRARCRFYNTKKGCRAGESCPFRHEAPRTDVEATTSSISNVATISADLVQSGERSSSQHTQPQQPGKPTPPDAKTFQINQIKRRFQPKEEVIENGTILLRFGMNPSDPDFPFDIATLDCSLKIPPGFPKGSKPSLRITNKEMERGFQINVEQGFNEIWRQASNPTLLNAMKVLDKRLEVLLTAQKAEIVTLIANAGSSAAVAQERPEGAFVPTQPSQKIVPNTPTRPLKQRNPRLETGSKPIITEERIVEAREKRGTETQLLEHRLNKDPKFSKSTSNNGTFFTIPIEPRKRNALPLNIQAVKQIRLFVPLDYDISPCSIELVGVEGETAEVVCKAFVDRAKQQPGVSLLAQVNYLAQNMHTMAKQTPSRTQSSTTIEDKPQAFVDASEPLQLVSEQPREPEGALDTDREHLKIIPRPPEWDAKPRREASGEESTDGYDSDYSTSDEDEDEEVEADGETETSNAASTQPANTRERGILISFPGLELYSIELLELVLISATVKCERCKDTLDIQRLKPQSEDIPSSTTPDANLLSTSCKKCASPFSLSYRKDIIHANSVRAGYLDLEGCTIVDLLPSTFIPTCAECSTPLQQGTTSVRGESTLSICRTCHRKLTFRIPEVKFLHVGGAGSRLPLKPTRKAPKESLGIVAGTPLPDRGRCRHYAKSYRWFRFSCCGKVFPCDKCHDKATDHPNEFANRMLCGWCSREQHYRPEDCGFSGCRKNVTGRTGSGFWEGGKGTRDRARMSRKDPRKYKRRGGGALASKNN